jgi:hypothetical protein
MQWFGLVAATLAVLAGVVAALLVVVIWRQGTREGHKIANPADETLITALPPDAVINTRVREPIDLSSYHLLRRRLG